MYWMSNQNKIYYLENIEKEQSIIWNKGDFNFLPNFIIIPSATSRSRFYYIEEIEIIVLIKNGGIGRLFSKNELIMQIGDPPISITEIIAIKMNPKNQYFAMLTSDNKIIIFSSNLNESNIINIQIPFSKSNKILWCSYTISILENSISSSI